MQNKLNKMDKREKIEKLFDEHLRDEVREANDIRTDIIDFAEKAVKLFAIPDVRKTKGTVCDHKKVNPYFAPVDECDKCGELIRQ